MYTGDLRVHAERRCTWLHANAVPSHVPPHRSIVDRCAYANVAVLLVADVAFLVSFSINDSFCSSE